MHRYQIPLELCHASTVHSCQGITAKSPGGVVFDRTDGQLFAMGLCYVAISRCQSIKDLILRRPIRPHDFQTHSAVTEVIMAEYIRLEDQFPQRTTIADGLREARKLLSNQCGLANC